MSLTTMAVLVLSGMGIFVALVGAMTRRRIRAGLPMALEIWTAAGMLKLSGAPTWTSMAVVAVFIALRRVVNLGLAD